MNREVGSAIGALGAYLTTVLPAVRRELREWRPVAEGIRDQASRRHALSALEEKAKNVEGVAVFAILAPRSRREAVVRAIVALQIAVDYLDTVEEAGVPTETARGQDGYLAALEEAWRREVEALPAAEAALALFERAVRRSAEGQARTHAAEKGDSAGLEAWARALPGPPDSRWWELAAGASSSVAAHALVAAAANPATTLRDAEMIDAAYNPSVGALTVLLDNLIDRETDAADAAHNYIDYYADPDETAARIAAIARDAGAAIARLPNHHRHEAILAGVAAFYVTDPGARTPAARPAAAELKAELGPAVRLIAAGISALRLFAPADA